MSQELCYTSAPRGLWPGSHGYCTVACTAGMPRALVERLESLSAYRPLHPPHDPRASLNPPSFSYTRVAVGGAPYRVLSRVSFAGLDYTDRANKYAHHVVLDEPDLPAAGPAWLLGQPGFMRESWDGRVEYLAENRPVPRGDVRPGICHAWKEATGDAGWAGVLAESFLADPKKLVFLIFEPGIELLPLIAESQALLTRAQRWDLTFSTYFTNLPQGVVCAWRGVIRDSPEAAAAQRMPQALVLDLTRPLGTAQGGALVEQARTGRRPHPNALPGTPAPSPGPRPIASDYALTIPRLPAETDESSPAGRRRVPRLPARPREELRELPQRQRAPVVLISATALTALVVGLSMIYLAPGFRGTKKATVKQVAINHDPAAIERPDNPTSPQAPSPESVAPPPTASAPAPRPSDPQDKTTDEKPPAKAKPASLTQADKPTGKEDAGKKPPETPPPAPLPEAEGIATADSATKPVAKSPTAPLHYEYISLPAANSMNKKECTLLEQIPFDRCELSIRGLEDGDEIGKLDLEAVQDTGPEASLSIHTKSPKDKKLATISVKDRSLNFRWEYDLIPTYKKHTDAIQSCVLWVRPQAQAAGEPKPIPIFLHKLERKQETLNLDRAKNGLLFEWKMEELPFGRLLEIHQCDVADDRVHPKAGGAKAGTKQVSSLTIAGYPNVTLEVALESPKTATDSSSSRRLVWRYTPSEDATKAGALGHITDLIKNVRPLLKENHNLYKHLDDDTIDKALSQLDGIAELARSVYPELQTGVPDYGALVMKADEILSSLNMLPAGLKDPALDRCKASTAEFKVDAATLDQLNTIKSDKSINTSRISVSFSVPVGDESVEVARIGEFKETAEKANSVSVTDGEGK